MCALHSVLITLVNSVFASTISVGDLYRIRCAEFKNDIGFSPARKVFKIWAEVEIEVLTFCVKNS